MTAGEREHLERVRDRFTRTAEQFARFALVTRAEEAERLVALARPRGDELALDLGCGPGTFTRAFATRVRFIAGLDLTPAMLEHAREATSRAGLANVAFTRADASLLPFAGAALGLAVCAYSFHHFLDPARAVRELGRVVRPGGRVAAVDIIVPDGADAEANNRIERARDPSHATTLSSVQIHALLEAFGLRVLASEIGERSRGFDEWMQVAGRPPGTPAYAETRRLMEASMPGDTAGFHPRFAPRPSAADGRPQGASSAGELEYVQTSLFVIAEKR